MIGAIEIHNYQSLYDIELELAPLTVIVGPSSSGKSAFTRAFKMLTSNERGTSFISHGERMTIIKATTENGTVTLKRGKGTDDNEYVIVPADPNTPQPSAWTKLGGTVPEEVSRFIGIDAKDPINYAGQFDSPYLLNSKETSGGEVARIFGSLTNVNVIFEGARESNRRKLTKAQTLKTRSTDLEAIMEKAKGYRALKDQRAALDTAEEALAAAREIAQRTNQLSDAIEIIDVADGVIARLEAVLETTVPSPDDIIAAHAKLIEFKGILATLKEAAAEQKVATDKISMLDTKEADLQQEFAQTLGQIAGGIAIHWKDNARTAQSFERSDDIYIEVVEGAQLAAEYIAGVLTS